MGFADIRFVTKRRSKLSPNKVRPPRTADVKTKGVRQTIARLANSHWPPNRSQGKAAFF